MKIIMPLVIASRIVGAGFLGTSLASHHYQGCKMSFTELDALDTDNDGTISFDEFSAQYMTWLESAYEMIDVDGDETLSSEEWDRMLKAHGVGKQDK